MSEFQKISLEECAERLLAMERPQIVMHVHPDGDTVGSAAALARALLSIDKEPILLCGDPIPERLCFLTEGLTVGTPEKGRETLAVDVASPAQLGALWESYEGKIDLMIDHHGMGTPYAPNHIVPDAAACAEILFDLSRAWLRMGAISYIPAEADTCIYAGMNTDTGSFKYSNVTPKTHRCAAELHRAGVDSAAITQKLYGTKPYLQLKAEGAGIRSLTFFADGRIAVVRFPYALKQELGVADEHLETLVDMARGIEGVEVAVSIRQPGEETVFRCSTRANGTVDVSAVCAAFGGGGHVRAAGCTLTDFATMEAAIEAVVAEIEKQL